MNAASVDPERRAALDALLLPLPGTVRGQMFGSPAWYVGGRMYACLYQDGVALKVPKDRIAGLLADPAIEPFHPMGRAMREWVHIRRTPGDAGRDMETLQAAHAYVLSLGPK